MYILVYPVMANEQKLIGVTQDKDGAWKRSKTCGDVSCYTSERWTDSPTVQSRARLEKQLRFQDML